MNPLRVFLRSETGASATIIALTMPLVLGSIALAVEASLWYLTDRRLQTSADVAAYAAGLEIAAGRPEQVEAAVAASLSRAAVEATSVVTYPEGGNPELVRVTLSRSMPRLISAIITAGDALSLQRTAVARAVPLSDGQACLLALETQPFSGRGISITGRAAAWITGCGIHSNAVGPEAIFIDSNGSVDLGCVASSGEVVVGSNQDFRLSDSTCSAPRQNTSQAADPMAYLPVPARPFDFRTVPSSGDPIVLQPGLYASGMDLRGNIILEPGLYYVENSFRVNANANVVVNTGAVDTITPTGNGVVFYFSGALSFAMNGSALIELVAPTTGTYEGVLFFFDPHVTPSNGYQINGTFSGGMTGTIYAPRAPLVIGGASAVGDTGTLEAPCLQIVARTIDLQGASSLVIDCSNGRGNEGVSMPSLVRLVE